MSASPPEPFVHPARAHITNCNAPIAQALDLLARVASNSTPGSIERDQLADARKHIKTVVDHMDKAWLACGGAPYPSRPLSGNELEYTRAAIDGCEEARRQLWETLTHTIDRVGGRVTAAEHSALESAREFTTQAGTQIKKAMKLLTARKLAAPVEIEQTMRTLNDVLRLIDAPEPSEADNTAAFNRLNHDVKGKDCIRKVGAEKLVDTALDALMRCYCRSTATPPIIQSASGQARVHLREVLAKLNDASQKLGSEDLVASAAPTVSATMKLDDVLPAKPPSPAKHVGDLLACALAAIKNNPSTESEMRSALRFILRVGDILDTGVVGTRAIDEHVTIARQALARGAHSMSTQWTTDNEAECAREAIEKAIAVLETDGLRSAPPPPVLPEKTKAPLATMKHDDVFSVNHALAEAMILICETPLDRGHRIMASAHLLNAAGWLSHFDDDAGIKPKLFSAVAMLAAIEFGEAQLGLTKSLISDVAALFCQREKLAVEPSNDLEKVRRELQAALKLLTTTTPLLRREASEARDHVLRAVAACPPVHAPGSMATLRRLSFVVSILDGDDLSIQRVARGESYIREALVILGVATHTKKDGVPDMNYSAMADATRVLRSAVDRLCRPTTTRAEIEQAETQIVRALEIIDIHSTGAAGREMFIQAYAKQPLCQEDEPPVKLSAAPTAVCRLIEWRDYAHTPNNPEATNFALTLMRARAEEFQRAYGLTPLTPAPFTRTFPGSLTMTIVTLDWPVLTAAAAAPVPDKKK